MGQVGQGNRLPAVGGDRAAGGVPTHGQGSIEDTGHRPAVNGCRGLKGIRGKVLADSFLRRPPDGILGIDVGLGHIGEAVLPRRLTQVTVEHRNELFPCDRVVGPNTPLP